MARFFQRESKTSRIFDIVHDEGSQRLFCHDYRAARARRNSCYATRARGRGWWKSQGRSPADYFPDQVRMDIEPSDVPSRSAYMIVFWHPRDLKKVLPETLIPGAPERTSLLPVSAEDKVRHGTTSLPALPEEFEEYFEDEE